MEANDLVAWARAEAARLRTDEARSTSAGVEFLRVHAGSASAFYAEAAESRGLKRGRVPAALDAWAEFFAAGLAETPLALSLRLEAATDLMEQVRRLLDDSSVHPAAPVMLAGAALEEFLRGLLAKTSETLKGRGIDAYAAALRRADVLDAQDAKDVTALAGLRNAAAHGEFDKVTIDQARLMEMQVNLFMQKKA